MSNNKSLKGHTALVTGASSGLGAEFARQLAALGADLVLVARRKDKLEAVAQEVQKAYGINTTLYTQDLSKPDAALSLYQKIRADKINVDVLINNAGFGVFGYFDESEWAQQNTMIDVDIKALTQLTRLFLDDMKENNYGRILLVASIAAYQSTPLFATYAAAKAFVLYFGEALRYELKKKKYNIHVSVLSPGVTETEFFQVARQKKTLYHKLFMMQAPQVVKVGIKGMLRNKLSRIPGFMNWLLANSVRLVPRSWVPGIAHKFMHSDQ